MDSEDFESETNSEAEEEFPPTDDEVMQSQVRKPFLEITTACMPLNEIALKGIQMKELGDIQLPVSLQVKKNIFHFFLSSSHKCNLI